MMGSERMGDHFCPNCGTEVEADARFCPTCGTILSGDQDAPGPAARQSDQPQLPPAPAWPPPETAATAAGSDPAQEAAQAALQPEPELESDASPVTEQLTEPQRAPERGPEPLPEPPPPGTAIPPPAAPPPPQSAPAGASPELPFTWPTMLSGWLIGGGSLLGAIFLIASLGSVVSLLLFLALLAIAASVFLADRVPDVPRLRLIILATTMVGLGVGLGRAGFTFQGADTLFLVAMLAAAGGALLIELDRDRPMPPPERPA
jgi:hypothetical protein